jgi:excinuclease UvrABC ATPase subunit
VLDVLDRLKAAGNSLFVVEHDRDVARRADWVVDIGPDAGEGCGRVLYSGLVAGLERVGESATSQYLFGRAQPLDHRPRTSHGWLHLRGVSRRNLHDVSVDVLLCVLTAVTGVSGSGKSTLVTQVLAEVVRGHLGLVPEEPDEAQLEADVQDASGIESFDRLVRVDQRSIGRTPRSNLATCTGMWRSPTAARTSRKYWRCPSTPPPSSCPPSRPPPAVLRRCARWDLGYLRLGQPATELSGGEAQRIKLATELQRARRGHALYLLDEPTAGLQGAAEGAPSVYVRTISRAAVRVEDDFGPAVVAGAEMLVSVYPTAALFSTSSWETIQDGSASPARTRPPGEFGGLPDGG